VEDAALIGDAELYLHIARDIHQILREASGNEFLERFMSSLYILSRRFSFTHRRLLNAPNITRAASTHAGILRAVAARDETEAANASARMMEFLREFTLSSRDARVDSGERSSPSYRTLQVTR
jgi:DNA-binding FadR family transcriptional regulator